MNFLNYTSYLLLGAVLIGKASVSADEVYSTKFEAAENKKYVLRTEATLAPGEGIDNSTALKISRSDGTKYFVSGINLGKLPPGSYTLTMQVKAENICNNNGKRSSNVQVMAIEHHQNKKYLAMKSTFIPVPQSGSWGNFQLVFDVPEQATRTGLSLFLRRGMTGTVWLDDIKIINNRQKMPDTTAPITVQTAKNFPDDNSSKMIFSTSFEPSEKKKYSLRTEAAIVSNEGFNGTSALKITRSDSKQYFVSGCSLGKLEPGSYTLTMKLRAENIRNSQGKRNSNVQVMAFEHYNKQKYVSQNTQFFHVPPQGTWNTVKFTFQAPASTTHSSFSIFLRRGMTGTFWLDDVTISKNSGEIPVVTLLKPERLTVFGNQTEIVFNGVQGTPPGTVALVTLGSESKLITNGSDGLFKAKFDNLVNGKHPLEIKIIDAQKRVVKSKYSFNIFVKPEQKTPDYAVKFDKNQNLLVNNTPYMIIGIYSLNKFAEEVAEAGFNTIIDYTLFGDKGEKVNRIANIRKRLDDLQKHNIKALVSVQHQYPGRPSATTNFDNVSGVYECVTAAAEGIKNHPALLGWYVSDEMPRDGLPMVQKIREAVSIADPWHPTYTLTCRPDDMPVYAHTGDVIGMDPYPIYSSNINHSIRDVANQTLLCKKTGQPVWMTTQGFSWAVYDGTPAEKYAKSRKLKADELIAMPLLAAIHGAKGFIFFSYDGAVTKTEKLSEADAKANWAALKRAAGILKELTPFITSGIAKDIKFEANQAGTFRGKIFEDGKGNVRVVLVGMHNKAVARFKLPGYPVLKSMNKLTQYKKNGLYEINVDGVQFDILSN